MARETRTNAELSLKDLGFTGSGPFEALVVSHMDPTYMGGLKVNLLKKNSAGIISERVGNTIEVRYLSPFYGVTNLEHAKANEGYENTQKSYGMWFVPPDAGTRVLVIFAEGDISRGFWIGCVQDQYMNFMLPDSRASTSYTTQGTPSELRGKKLPTGEYNKKTQTQDTNDPTQNAKPYNDLFTDTLQTQGLLDDENRGVTSSSARREVPSSVFGISTPGPVDKREGAPKGLYGEKGFKADVFVNRLGGFSFVMDDGDDKFLRKGSPADSPPEYSSVEKGETGGDRTRPHNELLRLRTRSGHQIIMHNSEDLIYIGNARGTTWIELTSNGKIDIYANDSISVHSDQDINFTADRDVNIEGGRNINMRARGRESGGDIQMESKNDTHILAENDMKVDVKNDQDTKVGNDHKLTVGNDSDVKVTQGLFNSATNINHKASANVNSEAGALLNTLGATGVNIESGSGPLNVLSGAILNLNGSSNVNILGPLVAIDSVVSLSGGAAGPASPASPAQDAIEAREFEPLLVHNNSQVIPSDMSVTSVESIVKRMPGHEPWAHHENLKPMSFTPEKTDITVEENITDVDLVITTDTFRKANDGQQTQSLPGAQSVTPFNDRAETGLPTRANPSTVPDSLIDFIIAKEGFRASAYWDVEQYTNGYGTKARSPNETITKEVARSRLQSDLARRRAFVTQYGLNNGYNWNEDQVDSLTSFAYNLGTGSLSQLTNNGTRSNREIADKIPLYNKADGQTLTGLVSRRNEEADWFRQATV